MFNFRSKTKLTPLQKIENLISEASCLSTLNYNQSEDFVRKVIVFNKVVLKSDTFHHQALCEISFRFSGTFLSSGQDFVKDAWLKGQTTLINILGSMKQEIELLSEVSAELSVPSKITIPWLWKNSSLTFIWSSGLFVVSVFLAGVASSDYVDKLKTLVLSSLQQPQPAIQAPEKQKEIPRK